METTGRQQYIGIDVSKVHLDVAVLPANTSFQVTNDAAGWDHLLRQLGTAVPSCVVVEATNTYHVGAWLALAAAGWDVAVIDPARTHAFAKSEGIRAKTDRHDAKLLARFGQQKQPAPSAVPSAVMRTLAELVRGRDDLVRAYVTAKNQRHSADDATVRAVHQRHVDHLATEIAALEAQIDDLLATDAELVERRRRLQSTPGVGEVLSAKLVTALPELGLVDRRAIASLAGVAPHPQESGTTQKSRACGGGRRPVTTALYQLTLTAVRCNAVVQAHYERLAARKPLKVARIATARWLLGILTAMLRDGLTWQETDVGQGMFLPDAP